MKTPRPVVAPFRGALPLALLVSLVPGHLQAGSEPQFRIVAGQGAGGGPTVQRRDFAPDRFPFYPRAFRVDLPGVSHVLPGSSIAIDEPGVHLAVGDLDGDGRAELVTCTVKGGAGGGPHIRIYSHGSGGGGGSGAPAELSDPHTQFPIPAVAPVQHYVATGNFQDGVSRIITGAGAGGGPHVKIFTPAGQEVGSLEPYGPAFNGGIRVATGDVTGDGIDEIITATGAGGGPHVKVFDGLTQSEIYSFDPYDAAFTGGVHVAAGDLDGDGRAEIITATGAGGGPHVKVFSGVGFEPGKIPPGVSYFPFNGRVMGGVRVAVGDLDGDGRQDLVIAGVVDGRRRVEVLKSNKNGDPDANREMWSWTDEKAAEGDQFPIAVGDFDEDGIAELAIGGVAPRALIWSPRSNLSLNIDAYPPAFTGGVRVASGDVNGDGVQEVIVASGAGGGPHVKAFDGRTGAEIRSFFAYAPTFLGGVSVAAGDVNGDGAADIVTGAGAGGAPHVKVFDGRTGAEIRSFFAYAAGFTGGVNVAAGDVNGDGAADIITGSGAGAGPHVKVFSGATGAELHSFFAFDPGYTGGVHVAAVAADGLLLPAVQRRFAASRIVGGGPGGGPHVKVFDGLTAAELGSFSPFGEEFTGGVDVAHGDVDGDGVAELLAGASLPGEGPTVVGLDLATRTQELRCHLFPGLTPVSGEAPSFAISARPQPVLAMLAPAMLPEGFHVSATGTPGTWLDFETSEDLLNWLPWSSDYIPDGDHILIGTTTPVVQGTRHYVRAVAK